MKSRVKCKQVAKIKLDIVLRTGNNPSVQEPASKSQSVGVRRVNISDAYKIKLVLKIYIAFSEVVGHNQIFLLISR